MLNLQTYYHYKLDFQKVDKHFYFLLSYNDRIEIDTSISVIDSMTSNEAFGFTPDCCELPM